MSNNYGAKVGQAFAEGGRCGDPAKLFCKSTGYILTYPNFSWCRDDIKKRRKHYISDWTDAFDNKRQCIPAILFLYFACLAPVVSFGTIASQITEGSIGVVEFLLASGSAGMVRFISVSSRFD